jgi:cytochrome c553
MNMFQPKKLLITALLSATVVFAATANMQNEPEKPQWKNLKVLPKNISKEELHKVMDDWEHALGVKCGFCHARDNDAKKMDWASDAKPEKEMARKMMTMTAKINKKWFKADKDEHKEMMAAIQCITCHNGKAHPEGEKGGMDHMAPPPPPPAPPAPATPPNQ